MGLNTIIVCILMQSFACVFTEGICPPTTQENECRSLEAEVSKLQHDISKINSAVGETASDLKDLNENYAACATTNNIILKAFAKQKQITGNDFADLDDRLVYLSSRLQAQMHVSENFVNSVNDRMKEIDANSKQIGDVKATVERLVQSFHSVKQCPTNWHRYLESCYYVSDEKVDWNTAKGRCERMAGYLIEYDDIGEVNFAMNIFKILTKYDKDYLWAGFFTGASDSHQEGNWVWVKSGKLFKSSFTFWLASMPDNYRNEDCLITSVNQKGRWNDGQCASKFRYICEKPLHMHS